MFRYILDRIVAMFLTLFIIVSIAFMVVRLMPGSVYEMGGDLSQTVIDALNAKYHFDEPIIKQYGYFLQNIFLRQRRQRVLPLQVLHQLLQGCHRIHINAVNQLALGSVGLRNIHLLRPALLGIHNHGKHA